MSAATMVISATIKMGCIMLISRVNTVYWVSESRITLPSDNFFASYICLWVRISEKRVLSP